MFGANTSEAMIVSSIQHRASRVGWCTNTEPFFADLASRTTPKRMKNDYSPAVDTQCKKIITSYVRCGRCCEQLVARFVHAK
jgi:hypothetical protein